MTKAVGLWNNLIMYNTIAQKAMSIRKSRFILHLAGRNDSGMLMPSGVYLFRIETDNFQQVNKMMLMK